MSVSKQAGPRFLAFDGVRGLLSLLVILSHFPGYTILHHTRFAETGSSLIDLFFVFSGFVIVGAFGKPLAEGYGVRRFLIERLGRFYPIHFAVLLLFVVTELLMAPFLASYAMSGREAFTLGNSVGAILSNLTLTQSLGLHATLTWNYPSWSLSTEFATYIFFALAMAFGGRRFLPIVIVCLVASGAVLMLIAPDQMRSTYDFGVFRSIYGFAAGALCFYVYHFIRERRLLTSVSPLYFTVAEVLVLVMLFVVQVNLGLTRAAFLIPLSHTLILLVFAFEGGIVSRVLSKPAFVYLGAISLSTYIIHMWVLLRSVNIAMVIERLTGLDLVVVDTSGSTARTIFSADVWTASALAVFLTMVVLVLSHFAYRYIEMPGQTLFRDFARRYRAEPVTKTVSSGQPSRVVRA